MEEKLFLDMADAEIAEDEELILAEGIGSCVVVLIRDVEDEVSGGAHVVLPAESEKSSKAADTLIDELVGELKSSGAEKENLEAKVFGGADIFGFSEGIGDENVESVKEILDEKGIKITAEDTGGEKGRSIEYHCDSGRVEVCDSQQNCKHY